MSGTKPKLKLAGTDGNAFSVIAACKVAAKAAGWSRETISSMQQDMLSGDYDNVLRIAIEKFEVS